MSAERPVLLIEDEAPARRILAAGLERRGWRITAVGSTEEALPLLHHPWLVIVTDLRLPKADGLALVQEARRCGTTAALVLMTAYADKDRAIAALNLGVDHLIEKPFSVDALAVVLTNLTAEATSIAPVIPVERLEQLPLSLQDRRLVEALLRGRSNQQIANELGLAEQSVKNRLSRIYLRLGVEGRTALMAFLLAK